MRPGGVPHRGMPTRVRARGQGGADV